MAPQPAAPRPALDALEVLGAVPGIVVVIDETGTVQWISEPMEELSGYCREELVGTNMLEHLHPEGNEEALASIAYTLNTPGRRLPTVLRFLKRNGSSLYMEASANNQLQNPALSALVVHLQPCEERQLLDQVLEGFVAGEGLSATIGRVHAVAAAETLDSGSALVLLPGGADEPGSLHASDPGIHALTRTLARDTPWMTAADLDDVVYVPVPDLVDGPIRLGATAQRYASCWCFPVSRAGTDHVDAVLVFWRRQKGEPEPNAAMLAAKLVRLCELVLERAEHSRQLEHTASHDPLTGLANRATFFAAVQDHLDGAGSVGVLYLDLDGFKSVNDRLGHGTGDQVLQAVATRLSSSVRSTDTVARLGGDEFAVVCPAASARDLLRLSEHLVGVIGAPIPVGPQHTRVGVSIGSAVCDLPGTTADHLVAEADASLLEVKAAHKGRWKVVTLND